MIDPVHWAQKFATAVDFERAVLADCELQVGCDVAFFSVTGRETSPTVLGLDRATVEQAVAGGPVYARELMPVKRAALARRGVAVDSDVLGVATMRKSRYYREVAARVGGKHSLLAYLSWQGQPYGMLMLGRTGRAFSGSEVERVEAMLPALGVARAAYGWTAPCAPLAEAPAGALAHLAQRLGLRSERVLGSVDTPSGTISVRDRAGFREMLAARGEHELVWSRAALDDAARSGWPYLELFHVAAACARRRERALFVGLGGAVSVRQFARTYPGIRCDVVEKEPAVVALAREFFALDAIPGVTVHVADGADFIANAARESWDMVIVDAYDAVELGAEFSTRRFFAALRRALRPGGTIALNVIGALSGRVVAGVAQAASREFAELRLVPVMEPGETFAAETPRNVVIVAVRPDGA
ncbi:MAG TPA: fused MFS/spermidine synthase [Polyangiaceae bacterium]